MKVCIFHKKNDFDILTLDETWLKIKFKIDILNYIITRTDRPTDIGDNEDVLLPLCVIILM